MSVEEEVNKKRTGLRWKARRPRKLKYVDDGMLLSKINMDSAALGSCCQDRPCKNKHDIQS